jgi:predicted SAM-dependent methyltransferase
MSLSLKQVPLLFLPPVVVQLWHGLHRSIARVVAQRRIAAHSRLHLACGDHLLVGWANVDMHGPRHVIRWDLTRALPIATASMDFVYSEHFIEHIDRHQAERLLRECRRVLKPGGVLRVSTPSLRVLVDEYDAGRVLGWQDMGWTPATPCQLLNEGMRMWGHQYIFDAPELEGLMRGAGFSQIVARPWRQSPHDALANLECRPYHGELIYDCSA